MPRRKTVQGAGASSRGLVGGQTTQRRLSQLFGLRGGLNNNSDISAQSPSEWINCTNARIPVLNNSNALGAVVNTKMPINMGTSYNTYASGFNYNGIPNTAFVANLNNTILPAETYVESGSGTTTLVHTNGIISQSYVQFAMTNGQTCTHTATIPSLNLGLLNFTTPVLALDMNNLTSYSSGYIRIGTDSSNYWQWNFTQTDTSGNFVPIKFLFNSPSSTTGSPNAFVITYVQVSLTANATVTTKFIYLRIGSFTSTSSATLTFNPFEACISSMFPYVFLNNPLTTITNYSYIFNVANQNQTSTLFMSPLNGSGTTPDNNMSWQPMFDGFYNGKGYRYMNFATFPNSGTNQKNTLYFCNGNDGVFSVDLNASTPTMAQVTSTKFKYMASYQNYMWYAGDPANPNTITPSIIATPGTLDTSNAITIDPGNGQNSITGLLSMDNYLIIFRTTDIWIMTGNTTGLISAGGNVAVQKTMSTVGAISQQSICRAGALAFFFNGNAIYSFDGNKETLISQKINLAINGVAINSTSLSIAYNSYEEAIYVFCGTSGPSAFISSSNYKYYGAFIYTPLESNWAFIGGTADATSVMMGGFSFINQQSITPYWYTYGIYALTQSVASGSLPTSFNQNFLVQSSWNNVGEPYIQKDPAQVRLFLTCSQSNITGTLNFYKDFVQAVAYTTTFTVPQSGTSPYVEVNIGPGCQGHAFSVEVNVPNTNTYNSVVYSGYSLSWEDAEVI